MQKRYFGKDKILNLVLIICFFFNAFSSSALGALAPTTPAYNLQLPLLRYLSINSANPFNYFNFLLDKGTATEGSPERSRGIPDLTQEAKKLINYFFLGISLSADAFWVNLQPKDADKMTSQGLSRTDMGKVLLEQDLQLKKDVSRYLHPDNTFGKIFWERLYTEIGKDKVRREKITTSQRVWIVPDTATVVETADGAFISEAKLKVLLENEYLKAQMGTDEKLQMSTDKKQKQEEVIQASSERLMKEIIIPELTFDVNHSSLYAPLRQIYYSLILAEYFKRKHNHSTNSMNSKNSINSNDPYISLINQNTTVGLESELPWSKDKIFQEYLTSYQKGEYQIKRSLLGLARMYFSGGIKLNFAASPVTAAKFNMGEGVIKTISAELPRGMVELSTNEGKDRLSTAMHLNGTGDKTIPGEVEVVAGEETTGQETKRQAGSPMLPKDLEEKVDTVARLLAQIAKAGDVTFSYPVGWLDINYGDDVSPEDKSVAETMVKDYDTTLQTTDLLYNALRPISFYIRERYKKDRGLSFRILIPLRTPEEKIREILFEAIDAAISYPQKGKEAGSPITAYELVTNLWPGDNVEYWGGIPRLISTHEDLEGITGFLKLPSGRYSDILKRNIRDTLNERLRKGNEYLKRLFRELLEKKILSSPEQYEELRAILSLPVKVIFDKVIERKKFGLKDNPVPITYRDIIEYYGEHYNKDVEHTITNILSRVEKLKADPLMEGLLLRNGAVEPGLLVGAVTIALQDLFNKGPHDRWRVINQLWQKARNPEYKLEDNVESELQEIKLIQPDESMHSSIQNIILSAFKGEREPTGLVFPVPLSEIEEKRILIFEEIRKLLNSIIGRTIYVHMKDDPEESYELEAEGGIEFRVDSVGIHYFTVSRAVEPIRFLNYILNSNLYKDSWHYDAAGIEKAIRSKITELEEKQKANPTSPPEEGPKSASPLLPGKVDRAAEQLAQIAKLADVEFIYPYGNVDIIYGGDTSEEDISVGVKAIKELDDRSLYNVATAISRSKGVGRISITRGTPEEKIKEQLLEAIEGPQTEEGSKAGSPINKAELARFAGGRFREGTIFGKRPGDDEDSMLKVEILSAGNEWPNEILGLKDDGTGITNARGRHTGQGLYELEGYFSQLQEPYSDLYVDRELVQSVLRALKEQHKQTSKPETKEEQQSASPLTNKELIENYKKRIGDKRSVTIKLDLLNDYLDEGSGSFS